MGICINETGLDVIDVVNNKSLFPLVVYIGHDKQNVSDTVKSVNILEKTVTFYLRTLSGETILNDEGNDVLKATLPVTTLEIYKKDNLMRPIVKW